MSDLANVKVGDRLILSGRGADRVVMVDRLTPTRIYIAGMRSWFTRRGGEMAHSHDKWFRPTLRAASAEDLERVASASRRRHLVERLRCHEWSKTPLAALEAVADALDSAPPSSGSDPKGGA